MFYVLSFIDVTDIHFWIIYMQAWNIQNNVDLSLTGPVGQVYSLVVGTDLLFAGTQVNTFTDCKLFF